MVVQLGNLAEWAAAVGTIAAVATALLQVAKERQQREDDRSLASERERKLQASRVSAWVLSGPTMTESRPAIAFLNGSEEAVYNVIPTVVFVQGAGGPRTGEEWAKFDRDMSVPRTSVVLLPPGRWWVSVPNWGIAMGFRPAVEVAFTDRTGNHWVRRADGTLEELPKSPIEYYGDFGLHGPHDLVNPEPLQSGTDHRDTF